jgi:hypothetical protein
MTPPPPSGHRRPSAARRRGSTPRPAATPPSPSAEPQGVQCTRWGRGVGKRPPRGLFPPSAANRSAVQPLNNIHEYDGGMICYIFLKNPNRPPATVGDRDFSYTVGSHPRPRHQHFLLWVLELGRQLVEKPEVRRQLRRVLAARGSVVILMRSLYMSFVILRTKQTAGGGGGGGANAV